MTELTREDIEAAHLFAHTSIIVAKPQWQDTDERFDMEFNRLERVIALALEALDQREQGGWQDISSAPKDWTSILLYCPDCERDNENEVFEGFYSSAKYGGDDRWRDTDGGTFNPTHWMPLPTPPQEQEG